MTDTGNIPPYFCGFLCYQSDLWRLGAYHDPFTFPNPLWLCLEFLISHFTWNLSIFGEIFEILLFCSGYIRPPEILEVSSPGAALYSWFFSEILIERLGVITPDEKLITAPQVSSGQSKNLLIIYHRKVRKISGLNHSIEQVIRSIYGSSFIAASRIGADVRFSF